MRAMFWAACVVVVLAAVFGAGRLGAEGKKEPSAKPAPPAPRLRVGLLNLTYVIKNYDKYKDFQEEIKEIIKPFQQKDGELRARGDKLGKEGQRADLSVEEKEEIEGKLKAITRRIDDNNAKAKKVLGKKSDDQMKILYQDVLEAAKRYAAVHDLDAVMHYNDATTEEDLNSGANINRKVQTGALMPMYSAPGIDITKDITDLLKQGVPRN